MRYWKIIFNFKSHANPLHHCNKRNDGGGYTWTDKKNHLLAHKCCCCAIDSQLDTANAFPLYIYQFHVLTCDDITILNVEHIRMWKCQLCHLHLFRAHLLTLTLLHNILSECSVFSVCAKYVISKMVAHKMPEQSIFFWCCCCLTFWHRLFYLERWFAFSIHFAW